LYFFPEEIALLLLRELLFFLTVKISNKFLIAKFIFILIALIL